MDLDTRISEFLFHQKQMEAKRIRMGKLRALGSLELRVLECLIMIIPS